MPAGRTGASCTSSPTPGRPSSGWSGGPSPHRPGPVASSAVDGGHRAGRGHPAGAVRRVRALPGGGAAARGRDPAAGAWTVRPGRERLIEAGGPERALALAVNEEYTAAAVTVRTESLTEPPSWHDVDLATGRWVLRKRQEVPGYDPARYVTERISAPAGDGTLHPGHRRIPARAAPRRLRAVLLYGYGAYEAPSWPEFAVSTPSLLDRGFSLRGGARARRRGGRPPLVGRGASGPQAHHVHRLHRGGRTCWPARGGPRRTGSARAACRPVGCSRARCSPWRRSGGGRWSPRSRSWTW